jgi:hypothetical protein
VQVARVRSRLASQSRKLTAAVVSAAHVERLQVAGAGGAEPAGVGGATRGSGIAIAVRARLARALAAVGDIPYQAALARGGPRR